MNEERCFCAAAMADSFRCVRGCISGLISEISNDQSTVLELTDRPNDSGPVTDHSYSPMSPGANDRCLRCARPFGVHMDTGSTS